METNENVLINKVEDFNIGNTIKSGDQTLLKYKILDGDGEILDLADSPCRAVVKKHGREVYSTTDVTIAADNVAQFRITEVLPADEKKPYMVEFIINEDDKPQIFPSKDTIELYILSSSILEEKAIIQSAGCKTAEEIILKKANPILDGIDEAEATRRTSEDTRVTSEDTRVTNELAREIAETARQEDYSDSINTLEASAEKSKESAAIAQQAMSDYLSMLGVDVATLGADGKLSANQIPALAINDTFVVHSKEEIVALVAERGDVAVLVHDENVSDAYILTEDEPNVLDNWIKLGVSYVAKAGHAETATIAVDSQKINGHRVVTLSEEEYNLGAKDPETVYLVGEL